MMNFTSAKANGPYCHLKVFKWIVPASNPTKHLNAVYEIQLVTCLLNANFAVLTTLTNGCIITAIVRTPSLYSPSNFLLGCLSLTDFLTGLVVQPAVVVVSALMAQTEMTLPTLIFIYNHVLAPRLPFTLSLP